MRAIGIKQLGDRLPEYVRLAAGGETVLVTDDDRVVAELGPPRVAEVPEGTHPVLADLIRRGLATPPSRPPGTIVEGRPVATLAEILAELDADREDR